MIGTRLAHYEITSHLGSGGMGEVYQAVDSKLGRNVAIKLLLEAFARDSDRVARFEREARVLASLNHPNIAAIYGFEESAGRRFLVMELAEGETLAARIRKGPLPAHEASAIARQILQAYRTIVLACFNYDAEFHGIHFRPAWGKSEAPGFALSRSRFAPALDSRNIQVPDIENPSNRVIHDVVHGRRAGVKGGNRRHDDRADLRGVEH